MPRTARGRIATRRGPRAPTNWARICSSGSVVMTPGVKILVASIILSNPGINETIRRTRGMVTVESDQAAGDEDQLLAYGMVVVNDLALASGVAAIPGPSTDASDDGWFVWGTVMAHGLQSTAGGGGKPTYQMVEFDSKAMRRVEEGFGVAIVLQNCGASHGIQASISFSMLTSLT